MPPDNAVKRFVFKELKDGDLRKFRAESADVDTGGGARDQRFSPYQKFDPLFAAMFKKRETVKQKSSDASIRDSEVYVADVAVHIEDTRAKPTEQGVVEYEGAHYFVQTLKYWPPTLARPHEGRLGQVSRLKLVPPSDEGRVFLMIFEDNTPLSPRIAFVTETAIREESWEASINTFFKYVMAMPITAEAIMGYKDLIGKTEWIKPQ